MPCTMCGLQAQHSLARQPLPLPAHCRTLHVGSRVLPRARRMSLASAWMARHLHIRTTLWTASPRASEPVQGHVVLSTRYNPLLCPQVICIRADDPLAAKLNDVEDVERCGGISALPCFCFVLFCCLALSNSSQSVGCLLRNQPLHCRQPAAVGSAERCLPAVMWA